MFWGKRKPNSHCKLLCSSKFQDFKGIGAQMQGEMSGLDLLGFMNRDGSEGGKPRQGEEGEFQPG